MLGLVPRRRPRRLGLTPMIDVVFLLMVFFMLAARFGTEGTIKLATIGGGTGGGGSGWDGPPRLIEVVPGGALRLNGRLIESANLVPALARLMPAPDSTVILRGRDGAALGDLVPLVEHLSAAGIGSLVIAE